MLDDAYRRGLIIGSSPRVWGKFVGRSVDLDYLGGSSPRVWGKCRRECAAGHSHAVHPHGCGENAGGLSYRPPGKTVHPHGCGENADRKIKRDRASRFIPTGVGKMKIPNNLINRFSGSSPRVWGKLPHSGRRPPAAAVHPHGCGENSTRKTRLIPSAGSSPRVWGK